MTCFERIKFNINQHHLKSVSVFSPSSYYTVFQDVHPVYVGINLDKFEIIENNT